MGPHARSSTAALVLAGGKSSRMGRPKALLPFGDRPLIAHVVETLRPLFDEIVVVAAPEQDLPPLPVTLARDDVAYQGPVGGLCSGLKATGAGACFATSCDSAFLNPDLIRHLLSHLPGHDVVVPRWQGRMQPLHAVYRRSVLPLLEGQLARGELRPVFLFEKVRTRCVEEEEIRRVDPDGASFFNMNTPEEYAEALGRWRERDARRSAAVRCTVELYGLARLLARTREVPLVLPEGATYGHVFAALADTLPVLVGRVINSDRSGLTDGYACNANGLDFVRTPSVRVNPGDTIVILSADAGG